MKPNISFALLGALFAVGAASAAVTDPVGYTTEVLKPGQFNLIGVTMHEPTVVAGVLDSSTFNSVTDAAVDFATLLPLTGSGFYANQYILEITNGVGEGTIQVIKAIPGTNTLTTPDDISSLVVDNVTTYRIRKTSTLSSIFGANNEAGLTASPDGLPGTYDAVLVPDEAGTAFIECFYYDDGSFQQWYDTDFNEVENLPLVYADGLYVSRLPAVGDISLVISGEVKIGKTVSTILPGNTFSGLVWPVGLTLDSSGLKDSLVADNDGVPPFADQILVPKADGSYTTYFYYNDGSFEQWYDLDFNEGVGSLPLTSGAVFQSTTLTPKNITINQPTIAP